MMGEIIYDGDAVYLTANFAAAANALESDERISYGLALNSPGVGGNDDRQAVRTLKSPNSEV